MRVTATVQDRRRAPSCSRMCALIFPLSLGLMLSGSGSISSSVPLCSTRLRAAGVAAHSASPVLLGQVSPAGFGQLGSWRHDASSLHCLPMASADEVQVAVQWAVSLSPRCTASPWPRIRLPSSVPSQAGSLAWVPARHHGASPRYSPGRLAARRNVLAIALRHGPARGASLSRTSSCKTCHHGDHDAE